MYPPRGELLFKYHIKPHIYTTKNNMGENMKMLFDKNKFCKNAGYNKYSKKQYDQNIKVIPGYNKLNKYFLEELQNYNSKNQISMLELGVGTGLTSKIALDKKPNSTLLGIDILINMVEIANSNLQKYTDEDRVKILCTDYFSYINSQAKKLDSKFDIVF